MAISNKTFHHIGQNVATVHNGSVRNTGFSMEDLAYSLAEFIDAYYVIENERTKEKIHGNLGETLGAHMSWKRNGDKVTVHKVDKETAAVLYGKK